MPGSRRPARPARCVIDAWLTRWVFFELLNIIFNDINQLYFDGHIFHT
jgi:hypothetical protein